MTKHKTQSTNNRRANWTLLHAKFQQTLKQRNLLPPHQRILVAVSGGQDSLCLLKLLLDLQGKWQWDLAVAHCDHRWTADVGIADRVWSIARSWSVPYYLKVAENLPETEAAARHWRYQALSEIALDNNFSILVTGHTQSDRAETFLYNLIRGAGADGLQALNWRRSLVYPIQLVRPLLNVSRRETGEFCQQLQIPVWEDAYNYNLEYARNRLRSEVIPYLQTHFNPQVETSLAQTAELLKADVEYLEDSAQKLLQQALADKPTRLNRLCLRSAPLSLQRRAIRQFLRLVTFKAPNFKQIEAATNLIDSHNGSRTSSFPGGLFLEVQGDWIVVQKRSLTTAIR